MRFKNYSVIMLAVKRVPLDEGFFTKTAVRTLPLLPAQRQLQLQ
jgi:hypothetical protein